MAEEPRRTIKVACGANTQDAEVAGMTVAEVRRSMQDVLNIPEDAEAIISGDNVNNTYTLREGDVLEFVKKSGEKG